MFLDFLRNNTIAAGILTILRIYLGWNWMTAGWGKLTGDGGFSAQGFLTGAVNNEAVMENYPTYHAFIDNIVLPNVDLFSFMVSWGQFLVGLGLLLGVLTTAAAFFGMTMNFAFMFAGTVSSNPWMVLLTFFVVVAGYNAGKFGGDRWVIPYLRETLFKKIFKKQKNTA
ncbi:DoxX family membrane protein [Bacillus shivajii]|uniref:DoxX family membrane protein n=1 Tax=Bacillus shivajii TaxID=1983719 RepID=UPI001CFC26B5|nr:DoxX family membrane protein [Bacillus shivajii]UCZ51428.1 DoxX family membrane protein [Bacillus shivajii]